MTQLVVFDLDFTLWDCGGTWCDHTQPPFQKRGDIVIDSQQRQIRLYPEVRAILAHCQGASVKMALASRTGEPDWARQLLALFNIDHYFEHPQIYPTSKVRHFRTLQQATALDFDEMVFFDDEMRNIEEVAAMGVNAIYVNEGLTWALFHKALSDGNSLAP